MNKHISRRLITLALALILLVGIALPAGAAGVFTDIKAYVGGIPIYLNGKLTIPVNVNGTEVQPMLVDGTTYLPVRAISNMLGEDVDWDAATRSIYIGEPPAKGSVGVLAQDLKVFYSSSKFAVRTGESAKYEDPYNTYVPFNALMADDGKVITWRLDSDYKSIDGVLDAWYTSPYAGAKTISLKFYSIDRYGAETLIAQYSAQAADEAVEVSVDVTACDYVKLVISGDVTAVFSNITATTIG